MRKGDVRVAWKLPEANDEGPGTGD
jgi:hypothetical protein